LSVSLCVSYFSDKKFVGVYCAVFRAPLVLNSVKDIYSLLKVDVSDYWLIIMFFDR
jgi:hypothetical protein